MIFALRPSRTAGSISSRYGSHALAAGARLGVPESVDTPSRLAGFSALGAAGVGGHLLPTGRFWRLAAFAAPAPGYRRP